MGLYVQRSANAMVQHPRPSAVIMSAKRLGVDRTLICDQRMLFALPSMCLRTGPICFRFTSAALVHGSTQSPIASAFPDRLGVILVRFHTSLRFPRCVWRSGAYTGQPMTLSVMWHDYGH